jgi:tctex1 domain-containing protein 2
MTSSPQPVVRFQPSYRLESKKPFNKERCIKILKAVIDKTMENKEYDTKSAPGWCKAMSEDIKTQIKLLKYDR